MNIFTELINKVKNQKIDKKTIIILVIGFTLMILLCISEIDFTNDDETEKTEPVSDEEYCQYLESKIKTFIEKIDGAGETEVIITLAETTEYIYATDDKDIRKNDTNSDDSTFEKDYVIIENNNNDVGLLIKTIEPKIRGVAVSCEGGDNVDVQQQIYSTIEAILDIKTSNISISKLSIKENKDEKQNNW